MNAVLRVFSLAGFLVLFLTAGAALVDGQSVQNFSRADLGAPTLSGPISVYDDWGAYDELSDHVPLTQDLAMRELDQVLDRLYGPRTFRPFTLTP